MADILSAVIGKISALLGWDGTGFRTIKCDANGELQVDVLASGLPSGAATELTQQSMLAAVGDPDTPGAGSVNDRLAVLETAVNRVYAKNLQIADGVYFEAVAVTGDSGTISARTSAVPAGYYYYISKVVIRLYAGSAQSIYWRGVHDGVAYSFEAQLNPETTSIYALNANVLLDPGDYLIVYGYNVGAGSDVRMVAVGWKIKLTV